MCLFTGFGICSCDYLDVVPDMTPTLDNAFSDRYMAERFLATCYYGLPTVSVPEDNPALLGSLEMIYNRENQTYPGMLLGLGQNDRSTAIMDHWANGNPVGLYANIRDCNTFLDNIERVPDLPRPEKDRWIAEVKLIKAYCHFVLITKYGPMCIVRESAPVSTSTQGVRVYRDKVDDCFTYVVELLDEVIASNALPYMIMTTGTELGRFIKAAAYGIKAKVLVYWASPLFNGNTDYVNFLNHNKEPFFNQTYDPSRWVRAAEACKAAVAICEETNVRLFQQTDYLPTFPVSDTTALVNTLRQAICKRWNVELIWTNNYAYGGFQGYCMPRLETATQYYPTAGLLSLPFSTVDVFYTQHGVPIDEDDSYDYANRFDVRTGDFDHRYYIQQGEQTAAMNFNREPRFYSTLGFDRGKWYGNHYNNPPSKSNGDIGEDVDCRYPKARYGEYSSGFLPGQYNATGYWPKKLVSTTSSFTTADVWWTESYPFPNMRYADLLLLTAEAVNEAQATPDNEVWKYIDEVRARAGLDGVVNSWQNHASAAYKTKPTTQDGMRKIIQQERKIELACEGHYFWDSRRWKTAVKEQNNRPIQGWNHLGISVNDYYTPTTLYMQKFILRDYFFPIPESDFINNPQLIQNPGW
ncbi:hypothetical protein AGMMS50239_22410 [Bacteroidia bacterium]|nr:hypothetical protein AGMMS50239_22410 [Bacteroidia bacterium]